MVGFEQKNKRMVQEMFERNNIRCMKGKEANNFSERFEKIKTKQSSTTKINKIIN